MSRITKTKAVPFSGRTIAKSTIVPPGSSLCSSPTEHPKQSAEFVDRINYYLALPAFTFNNFTVDTNAEPIALFHYVIPKSISILEIPERGADVNYNLVIVIAGVRYKVWDENDFAFPITLYTGQRLGLEFDIEIWATDSNPVISTDEIRMRTSTLLDPNQCELTCLDAADIQEPYAITIAFLYASFAESTTITVSFSAAYLELVVLTFSEDASLALLLAPSQYYFSLEDAMSLSASLSSGQQFGPTFDSTSFTFDGTALTMDINVT